MLTYAQLFKFTLKIKANVFCKSKNIQVLTAQYSLLFISSLKIICQLQITSNIISDFHKNKKKMNTITLSGRNCRNRYKKYPNTYPCTWHSWQGVIVTTLGDKVYQWLAVGQWFSPPVKLTTSRSCFYQSIHSADSM
jgi:hypothetical protein